jgi:putative mRNA 3-end processing factor
VVVVSGDYKVEPDPTCTPFEPVRCHVFLTESTFGLPIYRWPRQAEVFAEIDAWWRGNQEAGRASLLFGYALGKAQRLLAGVDPSIGPIATHGAVEGLNRAYREAGVALPETRYAGSFPRGTEWSRHLIVAPPSAHGTPWARRFGPSSSTFASGWMQIRGTRRRRAVDRGFVVSDHADWPGLLATIEATGAEEVRVTHGYSSVLVRHLREAGLDAKVLATRYVGEGSEAETEAEQSADDVDGTGAEDQPLPP